MVNVKFGVGQKQIFAAAQARSLLEVSVRSWDRPSWKINDDEFLAGRLPEKKNISKEGTIYANGAKVDPRQFRENIAYVMQEDALFTNANPTRGVQFRPAAPAEFRLSRENRELVECMIDVLSPKVRRYADRQKMIPGISRREEADIDRN